MQLALANESLCQVQTNVSLLYKSCSLFTICSRDWVLRVKKNKTETLKEKKEEKC